MFTDYDVIIVGSGCAGLAAGIYTSRAGLNTGILERESMGGEMTVSYTHLDVYKRQPLSTALDSLGTIL